MRLLVDSGAERTMLTEDAVKRLQLPRDFQHATRTFGIGGPSTGFDALLPTAWCSAAQIFRSIGSRSLRSASRKRAGGAGADGLLGADILLAFDVDLNLPAHRLTMYRARRECPTAEPPWSAQYLAISGVISTDRDRLMLPFVLDGVNGRRPRHRRTGQLDQRNNGRADGSDGRACRRTGPSWRTVRRRRWLVRLHRFKRVAGRSRGDEWAGDASGAD